MMTSSNSINFIQLNLMTSSDLIYLTRSTLIHIQTLFHKFHLRTKFRPEGLSLAIIMGKVHVFSVFKLMHVIRVPL